MKKYNVAIVGLGKAGSRFDEEGRKLVWSHVGAYLFFNKKCNIVAGIDPCPNNRKLFEGRTKTKNSFTSIEEINTKKIDIISLATPLSIRLSLFEAIFAFDHLPKVIICEKPLCTNNKDRKKIISLCSNNKVSLLVHYNRRYQEFYKYLRNIISRKILGQIYSVTIKTPNRFWSVGSHAIDLLCYLLNSKPNNWQAIEIKEFEEKSEKAFDFVGSFDSGIIGRISTQGMSKMLIFEVEIVCESGRIIAYNNGKNLCIQKFKSSKEYYNYLVQSETEEIKIEENSSFKNIVEDAFNCIENCSEGISTGLTALESEDILDKIYNNSSN